LAPFLNQAVADAKISTKTGEAMFLAQMLHEMGTKSDLNEDGGKKAYQGKTYDYFFYMYDKDSPDPVRQAKAKELGNTQAGDGEKFHGRGYVQLTGRGNYEAAGKYLNLDLVNNPELANEPKNAVRIAAWFWRFGNGDLNNFSKEDSETNFQTVTKRINGGLTNYADRVRLYQNAKKELGL
jgi:predicted chitinase